MCVYCMVGDHTWRHDPPWGPPYRDPYVPMPLRPEKDIVPWDLDRLKEFKKLLEDIKELEETIAKLRTEKMCDEAKADYIKLLKERIDYLESKE